MSFYFAFYCSFEDIKRILARDCEFRRAALHGVSAASFSAQRDVLTRIPIPNVSGIRWRRQRAGFLQKNICVWRKAKGHTEPWAALHYVQARLLQFSRVDVTLFATAGALTSATG